MATEVMPHESPLHVHRWQARLLPLMSWMLIGLTAFFFLASLAQLLYLQAEIGREQPVTLSAEALGPSPSTAASVSEGLAAARFRAAAELEVQLVARRYHQATILLLARVWASYLGFVTGMILSLVGAAFILGKLREPASDVSLKAPGADWTIRSASPGLVMAVLGTALMLATLVTHHRIDVTDRPVYLMDAGAPPATPVAAPVPDMSDPYARPSRP